MNQAGNRFAAWTVAAGFALLFTGCAGIDSSRVTSPPSHTAPVDHSGAHPPPHLDLVPDAVFKPEPAAKFGNRPYSVLGATYTPLAGETPYSQQGMASWYGKKFHGNRTASGERYDMYKMTAAHPTLPIPSYVRITNLDTGTHVVVRINDRGPFHSSRVIDVSYTAALKLGMLKKGKLNVQIDRILAPDLVSKIE